MAEEESVAAAGGAAADKALTPEQREDRRMHLDHLQGIIGRLSQLGFMMKGWALTLAGGLLALSDKKADHRVATLCVVGIAIFWYLDAHLLADERAFRRRYEAAATGWDARLSLREHLPAKWTKRLWERVKAGFGSFTAVCYIGLIIATLFGWGVLSPK